MLPHGEASGVGMASTKAGKPWGIQTAVAAALAGALATLLALIATSTVAQPPAPGVRVTVTGDVLRISGTVHRQLPAALAEILDKHPRVRTILLDSPGGEVLGGLSTAAVIRGRGLNTMVPANSHCASACVILLAAGVERRVAPATRVGVHRWKYSRPASEADWQRDRAALRTAFAELGVSADIVDMMLAVPHDTIRWLTRSEMRGLRLITAETAGQ